MWPLFYRMISFDALVFVVSILDSQLKKTGEWLRRIVNEEELKQTLFVVVINSFDQPEEEGTSRLVNSVSRDLGLKELKSTIDVPERLVWYVVNAKHGENDSGWQAAIKKFTELMMTRYGTAGAASAFSVPNTPRSSPNHPPFSSSTPASVKSSPPPTPKTT